MMRLSSRINTLSASVTLAISLSFLSAAHGHAQAPANPEAPALDPAAQRAGAVARLEEAPNVAGLSQAVRTLQNQPGLDPAIKAEGASLIQKANDLAASGHGAEARRALFHAASVDLGRPWDASAEFAASLAVKPDLPISDAAQPVLVELSQTFAGQYKPRSGKLQVKLTLVQRGPSGGAKLVATHDVPPRDLNDSPLRIAVDLTAVKDGDYMLEADLLDGDQVVGKTRSAVVLVHGIETRRAEIERDLAKIKGHDDLKASILYPFDHIRAMNAGTGESLAYDYPAALKRSDELLASLEKGKDPLYQTTGDQKRAYYFAEAGEIMPYRIYVPSTWKPGMKMPVVLALHGSNLDENNMLTRGNGIVEKLAESHGYIVASPLGYRFSGGFGEVPPVPAGAGPSPFRMGGLPGAGPGGPPAGVVLTGGSDAHSRPLSEKDTFNVLERVVAEYGADRSRIYMTGNSMGGGGVWTFASKYPERFAAAAPCASSNDIRGLNFENVKKVPLLACVGSLDVDARKQVAQYGVAQSKALGGDAVYMELPGGTHGTGVEMAMPAIFDFFDAHRPK